MEFIELGTILIASILLLFTKQQPYEVGTVISVILKEAGAPRRTGHFRVPQ